MGAYGRTSTASKSVNMCLPSDHVDYEQWIGLGRPACWCYSRQCRGDADGKVEGNDMVGHYYSHFHDLGLLLASWDVKEPPAGPGIAAVTGSMGQAGICADFAHDIEGGLASGHFRVHFHDLSILLRHWSVAEPPRGPGIPPDCGMGENAAPPQVHIQSPSSGATYAATATIPISASASDTNGQVVAVTFFINSTMLITDNNAADGWNATWIESTAGSYTITARATDNQGQSTTSQPVYVTITSGGGGGGGGTPPPR